MKLGFRSIFTWWTLVAVVVNTTRDVDHPRRHERRSHLAAAEAAVAAEATVDARHDDMTADNFLFVDYLGDGELERRISFRGIAGKETSIGNSSKSLRLWQISDGKSFIQMIFSDDSELIDCEYVRQSALVTDFLRKFYGQVAEARSHNFTISPAAFSGHHSLFTSVTDREFREFIENDIPPSPAFHMADEFDESSPAMAATAAAAAMSNMTFVRLNSGDGVTALPDDLQAMLDYNGLKEKCDARHRTMKRMVHALGGDDDDARELAEGHLERQKRALADWLIAPNTKWCGRGHSAGKYNQLGGASRTDMCCRKHDHCKLNIHGMTGKWNLFNYRPFTISHCNCDRRHRRDLSELLRVPGTKWCGKGYSAKKYAEMGGLSRADRCCRQHDKSCPFWIMGFETKYGLFNWRLNTIMHCKCDERFRTCLKMADSADANMVGKLFFNIVQTKCFVLKPEKVCKRRSWWGKCELKVVRKRAHLRDNRRF